MNDKYMNAIYASMIQQMTMLTDPAAVADMRGRLRNFIARALPEDIFFMGMEAGLFYCKMYGVPVPISIEEIRDRTHTLDDQLTSKAMADWDAAQLHSPFKDYLDDLDEEDDDGLEPVRVGGGTRRPPGDDGTPSLSGMV